MRPERGRVPSGSNYSAITGFWCPLCFHILGIGINRDKWGFAFAFLGYNYVLFGLAFNRFFSLSRGEAFITRSIGLTPASSPLDLGIEYGSGPRS